MVWGGGVMVNKRGVKELSGRELAGFVKERQDQAVRSLLGRGVRPTLLILRDSDNPVITKYVNLKKRYGEDIGVKVIDRVAPAEELGGVIEEANEDKGVSGMIVQLPLSEKDLTDEIVQKITAEKDVDGLSGRGRFDSATATAINWLLAGHNVELEGKKIAVVGRGRLVGAPLIRMWRNSGYDLEVFGHDSDLGKLREYDVIVTATGVPHLIRPEMLKEGVVIVDAGTASEDGVLVGDVDDEVRGCVKVGAITPKIGGVGPLTVGVLFENGIAAAGRLG